MTSSNVRMISAAIALLAGAIASLSTALDVNVSIVLILVSGAMFVGEWVRSFKA